MKKFVFCAVAVIFFVAVLVSCSNGSSKKAEVEEIPVAGTEYVITKTSKGIFGVKLGQKQLVNDYIKIVYYKQDMFWADYASDFAGVHLQYKALLNPKKEKILLKGDSIYSEGNYLVSRENGRFSVYFPNQEIGFYALNDFVVSDNLIITDSYEGLGIYEISANNDTIIAPQKYYKKMVLLKGGKTEYLTLDNENVWLRINQKGEAVEQLTSASLKKYKNNKDWNDKKNCLVLFVK